MSFTPKRPDGRSLRTITLELLQTKQPEEVVSYSELATALDLDAEGDRPQIQQTVLAANKSLLRLNKRGVQAVRNVGYRILPAREHMLAANGHQDKANRQMRRTIEWFAGTNMSELTPQEIRIHQGQAMLAQAIYSSHQSLSRRIRKLEDLLDVSTDE